jgi:hypothetical protein
MEGDRRGVSLSLKSPVIMSQASLVKQISENVSSAPEFQCGYPCALNNVKWVMKGGAVVADKTKGQVR